MKRRKTRNELGRFEPVHSMSKSREYSSWMSMRRRCYYEKAPNYHRYGGRGIKVCGKWLDSFESFYRDMGNRPVHSSLDRVDNNGDYEPGNCKWSTAKEQSANKNIKSKTKIKSGVVGVYYNKVMDKWYAGIGVKGKLIWLGKYDTVEEAAITRKEAEGKYYEKKI